MNKLICLALVSAVLLGGCASTNIDRPAVLTQTNAEIRQLIIHAMANLLRGAQVQIADNALTETSTVEVHRTLIGSRGLGTVDRFHLINNRGVCYLVHQNTQNRQTLEGVSCVALATE